MENKMFLSDCNQRDFLVNLIIKDFGFHLIILTTRESDVDGKDVEAQIFEKEWLADEPLFDYDKVEYPQFNNVVFKQDTE